MAIIPALKNSLTYVIFINYQWNDIKLKHRHFCVCWSIQNPTFFFLRIIHQVFCEFLHERIVFSSFGFFFGDVAIIRAEILMRQLRYPENITSDVHLPRYITELIYRFSIGRDLLPATDTNVQLRKSYSLPSTLSTGSFIPLKKLTVPPLCLLRLSSCVPFPRCIRRLQAAQYDDVYLQLEALGNSIHKSEICIGFYEKEKNYGTTTEATWYINIRCAEKI